MTKGKNTYFISDTHLGTSYDTDSRERERRVVDWLQSIADDASTLYLVGDMLDYWYEYRTVVPRGFVRFFGALASLADRGVKIVWLTGNHDIWLFDYLRNEIGLEVADHELTPTIGDKRFFIAHGDGVGRVPRSFRVIRRLFRNRFCQWLYASVHPRWTVALAHRWSAGSRKRETANPPFAGRDESLVEFALDELSRNPSINYFVFGHRHLTVDIPLTGECRFIILGDWLGNDSYGVFDGTDFRLVSLADNEIITRF